MPLQQVTSLRCRAQDNDPAASYWMRRVLHRFAVHDDAHYRVVCIIGRETTAGA